MNVKKSLPIICYTGWCGLGFFRGINSYKYSHNKYEKKEEYLYLNLFGNGFFGAIIYANPFCLPLTLYKEIYRLEVATRNLENEKNSSFYNNLL